MDPISLALGVVSVIGKFATSTGVVPGIVKALAGDKAAAAAETVLEKVNGIFGTNDPKQLELMLQQDKSKADLALAQLNKDLEFYRLQVEDTKDARSRDIEVRKLSGGVNARANIMLVGAFCYLVGVTLAIIWFRKDIPGEVLALMNMSIGAVLGMLVQAFNFEFGSSRASGEKTDQLASMIAAIGGKK